VISRHPFALELLIIFFVRRIISSLLLLAFAASLRASVPAATAAKFQQSSAGMCVDDIKVRQNLELTAAPADRRSFYAEFYSGEPLPTKAQRKSGLLRWFTSTVKKTAQKVNFFN
jgi:hypothetical protein